MSSLSVFSFENQSVRTLGTPESPLFVAIDVAKALGYSQPAKSVNDRLDPEDIIKVEIDTNGGRQTVNCVNESGLYSLIMGSTLPSAKRFKRWITNEVLPTIRKTGSYSLNQQPVIVDPAVMIQKALAGEIDANEASATLIGAAVLLQLTDTLKKTSPDTKIETLLQASQAFEQILQGKAQLVAPLTPDEEERRRYRSEVNRMNAQQRWHPEEWTPEDIERKRRFVERARAAAQARWSRVKQGGEQ